MLRSFTVLDPHLVNNICENPRYTKMSPEEILGKFVSGRMMIKEARYVDEALNGPIHEPQAIALKATNSKEALPSKVAQVEAAGLNEEEMSLIIKRFKRHSKVARSIPTKARRRESAPASSVVRLVILSLIVPIMIVTRNKRRRGKRRRLTRRLRERHTLARNGTRIVRRPTPTTKDSPPRPLTNRPSSPNEHHTCLMAKEKKVSTRNAIMYASSSDDESSDDEVDYASLFKGLDRTKIDKINELIDALNEKNRLLEKQEDLLYEEHDKFVSAQNSLALEVKRNEMLSYELSTCHESISSLKSINDDLNAKLEIASKSTSCIEHVMICNRCKDFNIDACSEHLVSISKLNDEVASLNAQLKTSKNEFDKLKFARDA
jgi:hypothetical protein